MSGTVSLSVVDGAMKGERLQFTEPTLVIAGRAGDCHLRIYEEGTPHLVSRHHCLFEVNPPDIRVRDFGSLNGTSVNDVEIGRRKKGQSPAESQMDAFPQQDLCDGDVVRLGNTALRVTIEVAPPPPQSTTLRCGKCGQTADSGAASGGDLLCQGCGATSDEVLDYLLKRGADGEPTLREIGNYDVVRPLGRGGQGAVYLVRHRDTGEVQALKLLLAQVSVEPEMSRRFLREIQSIQAVHHRNIVEFRQAGSLGGAFYLTMEFCSGGSVDDLVRKRGGPLSVEEALPIVLQALDGLAYAHTVFLGPDARGLVHRDIKPGNILLSQHDGKQIAKIGDFGLAKAFDLAGLSGYSMTGHAAGTPDFMARQQLLNYKYAKPSVDVWSMAASLYWMLAFQPPRRVRPGSDPILAVLNEPAVPISDRVSGIPKRLAEVIDSALVEDRPSEIDTASAFAQALRAAC